MCSVEVVRGQLVKLLDEKQRLHGAWMLDEKETVSWACWSLGLGMDTWILWDTL